MSDTGSCACGQTKGSCAAPAENKSTKPAGIQNGKGDAPRNISERFRSNYGQIRWSTGGKLKKGERLVRVYR